MKYSNIGGQAVMEGIMMRNGDKYSVGVRTVDGEIAVKTDTYQGPIRNKKIQKLPIVRGVVNFIDSLVLGMSTLMYSASFFAEETPAELEERLKDEKKKAEKKAEKLRRAGKNAEAGVVLAKFEEDAQQERERVANRGKEETPVEEKKQDNGLLMAATMVFSVVFSVALFMMLPYFLSRLMHMVTGSELIISIAEAILRFAIFLGYLYLISRTKDIQRVFMYHGAEHKCINCVEHGMPLTVENVRKSSREHKRCGTSFLLYVMIISVIFFMFIRVSSPLWRIVIRLLLVPVIAGVSYEFIRLAGRYDNACVNAMSKPGMLLQHMTTREPDDSMIEVGIAAVEAIFDWKKYLNENFGAEYDLSQESETDMEERKDA